MTKEEKKLGVLDQIELKNVLPTLALQNPAQTNDHLRSFREDPDEPCASQPQRSMSYQYPYNGYQGYGGNSSLYPQQYASPQSGYATSNYDLVALQLRIVRAKQVNLMCKQNLVRNMILSSNASAVQNRQEYPTYQHSNYGSNQYPQQNPYQQQQQQPRLYSQEEPQLTSQSSLPLLQRDLWNNRQASTPKAAEPLLSDGHEEMFRTTSPLATQPYKPAQQPPREQPPQAKASTREAYHRPTEVGDDEDDHAIPFEDFAASAAPQRPRDDVKILSTLAENMAQTVSDNTDALKKITAARKKIAQAPNAEKKKKFEQMIKVSANAPAVMPLWRHKQNGRHDPPPETVLKGIRLFRLVARSLLNFVVKPIVASVKHQLVVRESGRKDLQKTLKIVAGGIDDWIGKLVQLPVSSVAQDNTLSFEPVETFVGNAQPLRVRMLQLKVRLRGAITNIAKSEMPSDYVTDFLVALVEENNYYTTGLLWDSEIAQLEFTSMGATKDIAPELSVEQLSQGSYTELDYVRIPSEVKVGDEIVLHTARVRMLLLNFVFVRCLVNHIVLSPWNYNLCGDPSSRSLKRTIYNHRIFATSVYELVRHLDPTLPMIEVHTIAKTRSISPTGGQAGSKEGNKFITKNANTRAIGASLVAAANNARLPAPAIAPAADIGARAMSPRSPSGSRRGASSRAGLGSPMTSSRLITPSVGVSARVPTTSQKANAATAASEDPPDVVDPSAATPEAPSQSGLLMKLSRLMGMSDTTPGVDVLSKGSIESFLLEPRREEYTSLAAVHALLIPPAQLGALKTQLDEWFVDLKGPLNEWLQKLIKHVLARRLHQKLLREKNAL